MENEQPSELIPYPGLLSDDESERINARFIEKYRTSAPIESFLVEETPDWHTYPKLQGFIPEEAVEFLSIPKHEIPGLATKYVDAIETERTERWCACVWKIHPDDLEKPEGKRRKVRIEENEACVLHTKVGFVLGFFAWVFGEVEPIKDDD